MDKKEKDETSHKFLQVTDTEINDDGAGDWVNEVKEDAKREDVSFTIHTGDICYVDGLTAYKRYE